MSIRSDHSANEYPPTSTSHPRSFAIVEPQIDQQLIEVSKTKNLKTLESIQLRIMASMICCHHLEVFLPNLVALDLSGSELSSLRDLGTNLRIKSLNVSRCGLQNLDGTVGLATLCELIADENQINSIGQLCNLSELQKLTLRCNRIANFETVSYLILCPSILELDLRNNTVAKLHGYRDRVHEIMPTLKLLDGEAFYDEAPQCDTSLSSSEYCSSTCSDPSEGSGFKSLAGSSNCPLKSSKNSSASINDALSSLSSVSSSL